MPDAMRDGQNLLMQARQRSARSRKSNPSTLDECLKDEPLGWSSEQVCQDCGEPLWIVRLPGGDQVLSPCGECARRKNDAAFIRESIELAASKSLLHSHATLDSFVVSQPHQERGKTAATLFAKQMRRGKPSALVLWSSGYGTGKTHLASAIANIARGTGWIVESLLMPEFLTQIRASYNNDAGYDEYSLLRQAGMSDLLVLDELGLEHVAQAGWYQEKAYHLVNARYQRGPLVITTNKSITDLSSWIGGAAFSRLWEMTGRGQHIVDMCGPDWRMRTEMSVRRLK